MIDLQPDNSITDGVCLKSSGHNGYLFYKEDAQSLRMDLAKMEMPRKAVVVDTLKPYREIHIGCVLPKSFNGDVANQMMRSYLRRLSHEALDRRLAKLETIKTPEAATDYQRALKQFFFATIGQLPDRTSLNARVVGRAKRDGYRVENIVFESQPGFFVTANLYLPAARGPHPGILLPCGHSGNGKAPGAYQRASILLARNGFVVLCFDPIGQGERRQLFDPNGQPVFPGTTTEHMVEGIAPILLGRSLATYMIWDGMRAIDYLQSRIEVDPDRIGCTGNSGGGNLTSFVMALDDRIDAARRRKNSRAKGDRSTCQPR